MRYFIVLAVLLVFAVGVSACGKKGPPLPPLEETASIGR